MDGNGSIGTIRVRLKRGMLPLFAVMTLVTGVGIPASTGAAFDDVAAAATDTAEVFTLDGAIADGADDVEQAETGGIIVTSTDLELVEEANTGTQTVGLRYTQVDIPRGAQIDNAYVQFQTDEPRSVTGADPPRPPLDSGD